MDFAKLGFVPDIMNCRSQGSLLFQYIIVPVYKKNKEKQKKEKKKKKN